MLTLKTYNANVQQQNKNHDCSNNLKFLESADRSEITCVSRRTRHA